MAATMEEKRQWLSDLLRMGNVDFGTYKEENEYDAEKYEQYRTLLGNMIREGMVRDASGEIVKTDFEKLTENQKDALGTYMIRADEKDDPFIFEVEEAPESVPENPILLSASLRENPMTKQEFIEKNCKPLPKEPGRMSRFWDSIVRNVFRVKEGSDTCKKYREEKTLIERDNYYKITGAGYKTEKPEAVAKDERETAVRAYVLAAHQQKAGMEDSKTYDPEKDPEYNRLMNDPDIDAFVGRPETQKMLKRFRRDGAYNANDLKKLGAEYMDSEWGRNISEADDTLSAFVKLGDAFKTNGKAGLAAEGRKRILNQAGKNMMDSVREKLGGPEKAKENGAFLDALESIAGQDNELGRKTCSLFTELPKESVQAVAAEYREKAGNGFYSLEKTVSGIFDRNMGSLANLYSWTNKVAQNSNNGPEMK